jgi:hypothetical protein
MESADTEMKNDLESLPKSLASLCTEFVVA